MAGLDGKWMKWNEQTLEPDERLEVGQVHFQLTV